MTTGPEVAVSVSMTYIFTKPVRSEPLHDNNRKFLHIPFANKGIDAINISNILNRKEVVEVPFGDSHVE
jgi:hypothetical protein